ncbi:MAG: CBS domain-containing protein, partial [Gemmatimonadota bacterium]|nr:CBS domain-containing protein [Gemmatimonadota bacterium]
GFLNFVLAGFNLLPGFPLDGGRLFRALAWKATGDLTRATRWASDGGRILGYTLVTLGVIQVLGGLVVGGLWLVFIGWFLRTAAVFSFQQHVLRGVLRGVEARRVMTPHPTTVSPGLSLEDLVEERFLRDPYQSYPVLDRYGVVGLVTLDQVKSTPRDRWAHTRVGDVMTTPPGLLVSPESSLVDILERMAETKSNRVMVMADGKLVGVISPSDVSRWIQREQMIADLKERPR